MTMDLSTLAVLFPLLFLLLGLGFIVVIDPHIRREQRRSLLMIVVLCLSLIGQNLGENELFVRHTNLALKNFLSAYGYSVRPVILILFLYIICPEGKKWPWWTMACVNAALYFTSPFTKLCFEIRGSDFLSLRGPLWFTCFLISGLLLLELLIRTILRYRETRNIEQLIPVSVALIIAASVALDISMRTEQPIAFLTIAIVTGSVFYYIWLHLQFVREHENDLMAAQRIQIMMTQIQPLVENAIRHGVRRKKDGLVTVSTVRESEIHRIKVRDNGVGFAPQKQESTDDSHIGIRNVKDRLEKMCGGTMLLQSEIGKGASVTLLIPDGNEKRRTG